MTATVERQRLSTELSDGPNPLAGLNLYEKIAYITTQLHVTATGQNEFKAKAISIEDVENAVGPLMAEAGLVTHSSMIEKPDGQGRLYTVGPRISITEAESHATTDAVDWWDIGSNPSAAVSFALKRYYKALFHIATADDEGDATTTRDELVRENADRSERIATPRQRDTPAIPGLPKGFDPAHFTELKVLAESLPTTGDNPFVTKTEWAEKKLVARLSHHAKSADPTTAYRAMKAELEGFMPEPPADAAKAVSAAPGELPLA